MLSTWGKYLFREDTLAKHLVSMFLMTLPQNPGTVDVGVCEWADYWILEAQSKNKGLSDITLSLREWVMGT